METVVATLSGYVVVVVVAAIGTIVWAMTR